MKKPRSGSGNGASGDESGCFGERPDDIASTPSNDTAQSQRLPYMPWYPSDFAASTREWPLLARGIYRELLDLNWSLGSLPANTNFIRDRLVFATRREWTIAWQWIRPKFVLGTDGRLRNLRLEEHRRASIKRHENKRRAAFARWGTTPPEGSQ